LTFNIVYHIFRFFRIPVPRVPLLFTFSSFLSRGGVGQWGRSDGGRIPDDPVLAAERLVRELEDETGAITVSRARAIQAEAAPRAGPSSSTTSIFDDNSRKFLPDFHLGSYESALQLIRRDSRPLCVILISEEHDDTPAFKRDVLSNVEFVRALTEAEFVVWAGDIRGSEGHQSALSLANLKFAL
jgi:FAS-associated factor 2